MNNLILIQLFFHDITFKLYINYILFSIILLLIFINKICNTYNNNLYKYRIKNFKITYFSVILYFSSYLGILFYIRYTYLSKEVTLKPIKYFLYNICLKSDFLTNFLIIIFLLLMLFCFLLLFKLINDFFITLLTKKFIYIFYGKEKTYNIINNFIENFSLLSLKSKVDHIYLLCHLKMIQIFPRIFTDKLYHTVIKLHRFIFFNLPFIFFIIYFLYEVLFNDMTLSITFNRYLLFFVCYNIYKRISTFLIHTNMFLNKMLFDIYYRAHSIKYVNITEKYKNAIQTYLNDGLKHTLESRLQTFNHEFEFDCQHNNIFVTLNGVDYFNYKNEYFKMKDNATDVVTYMFK